MYKMSVDGSANIIDISGQELRMQEKKKEIHKQMILMIMRQTTYNEEETEEKIREHNHDYLKVIQEFMGITPKKEPSKTVNQHIYHEIRGMMDESASRFRRQQEIQQQREEMIQRYRQAQIKKAQEQRRKEEEKNDDSDI